MPIFLESWVLKQKVYMIFIKKIWFFDKNMIACFPAKIYKYEYLCSPATVFIKQHGQECPYVSIS